MLDAGFNKEGEEWLLEEFSNITHEVEILSPSEWAEKNRYLPAHTTPKPGYFRFSVAPYLKEIIDNFDPTSDVREVDFMKGSQVCATVGVLENIVGYAIDHLKSAPVMFLTADGELAKQRMDVNIIPMINYSNLNDRIKSVDDNNPRKTGKTEVRIEWVGGGFLLCYGARNADKLRSVSIKILLEDEVDAYPLVVGKDGDPQKLAEARTKAYAAVRKIFRNSTPLIKGTSKIERGFKAGDQRYYNVPCKKCGLKQVLRFQGVDKETGHVYGLVWDYTKEKNVKYDSVRYICKDPDCGHPHTNADKTFLLSEENGAEWIPTATSVRPNHRSYHLSALYSPVDFYSWADIVSDWVQAWDVENGRPLDNALLQEFYNNNLGETFELIGDKLTAADVSPHRRQSYKFGEVPNNYVEEVTASKILLLTLAVDVQQDYLSIGVFGWSKWSTAWCIDYFNIEGATDDLDGESSPWVQLDKFIREKVYESDDGRLYKFTMSLIDSSYRSDTVYQFCQGFDSAVYPIKGRKIGRKNSITKEFSKMETSLGVTGYLVTVDLYKDRWYSALKRKWDNVGEMPKGHFSAPMDITDKQLKELTVETKRLLVDPQTQKIVGTEWHRAGGAKNELWDLLVYNNAALDMVAFDVCRTQYELESVNWPAFWDYIEANEIYYLDA